MNPHGLTMMTRRSGRGDQGKQARRRQGQGGPTSSVWRDGAYAAEGVAEAEGMQEEAEARVQADGGEMEGVAGGAAMVARVVRAARTAMAVAKEVQGGATLAAMRDPVRRPARTPTHTRGKAATTLVQQGKTWTASSASHTMSRTHQGTCHV